MKIPYSISKYISQLHIVSLVASIIEFMSYEKKSEGVKEIKSQLSLNHIITQAFRSSEKITSDGHVFTQDDFNFIPDLTKEFSGQYDESAKESSLLKEYTNELLIHEIQTAIDLGRKAEMFYTLRPLYSLLLRIHHFNRDTKRTYETHEQFAQDERRIVSTNKNVLNKLRFYIVDRSEITEKETGFEVFCSKCDAQAFTETLRKSYNIKSDKPLNVISVKPNTNFPINNEYPHSFNSFVSVPDIRSAKISKADTEELEVFTYSTTDYSPHYRTSIDVTSVKSDKIKFTDYIQQEIETFVKQANLCSSEFEEFFQNEIDDRITPLKYIKNDTQRITLVLNDFFGDESSLSSVLEEMAKYYPEMCLKNYGKILSSALNRLMSVYERGMKENPSIRNEQLIQRVNEFYNKFKIADLKNITEYRGTIDPMEFVCKFEEVSSISASQSLESIKLHFSH